MAIDENSRGQYSLFELGMWRATVSMEPTHRLAVLCRSILWEEVLEKAIPILYDEQGIGRDTAGRKLDLRAHLGAYILQTVHGWTDRWTEEMLKFYIPARIFCGYLESEGSLDHTSIYELKRKSGILSWGRDRENWDTTQRERAIALKQKNSERAIGPPGRDRAPHRASQSAWARTESNENRSWGSNLGLPVCSVLQFKPFDERFRQKRNKFDSRIRENRTPLEQTKVVWNTTNDHAVRRDPSLRSG